MKRAICLLLLLLTLVAGCKVEEEIFYFDDYNVNWDPAWEWPDNMVDGNTGVFAVATKDWGVWEIHLNSNNWNGESGGIISSVYLRIFFSMEYDDVIQIKPYFDDYGEQPWIDITGPGEQWSDWAEITDVINAPDPWTWAGVRDLTVLVRTNSNTNQETVYVSKVEIKVLYEPTPELHVEIGAPQITSVSNMRKMETATTGKRRSTVTLKREQWRAVTKLISKASKKRTMEQIIYYDKSRGN